MELMFHCFQSTIDATALSIGLNICSQAWPMIFWANPLFGFINYKMTHKKVVVIPVNEFKMDDLKYVTEALIIEYFIDILQAFL